MSKDNVLQEIMKIARNHKITISTETFAKAGKALLIRRAIAFKRLSSPTKSKKKIIYSSTPDEFIMSLKVDDSRPLYISSLKERGIPVDKSALDLLGELDLQARLLNYRDYLISKDKELEKKMFEKISKDNAYFKAAIQNNDTHETNEQCVTTPETTCSKPLSTEKSDIDSQQSLQKQSSKNLVPQVSQDDGTNTEKSDPDNKQSTSTTTDASRNASKQDLSSKENTDTHSEASSSNNSKASNNEKNNNAMEPRRTIGTSNNPLASKHPRFDATHVNVVTSDSTTPSKKDHTLKEIRTSTITMRTAWFGQYYKLGMTACAKLFIQKILEVDQAARILPTNDNPDDIIVHENDFDGDNDNKWLRNSYYLHHEKGNSIHFTIRVKTIKSFKWMNQVISLFMRTTGNIVNMDTINANKLVTIGFFANFHRGLHNKQRLKNYCTRFLKEKFNLNIQMNIYPRNWYAGGGVNPDKAFLISVEVDTKIAQTVSNALMRCPFEGYTNIQYMPFTKYDDDYTERMRGVIAHHKVAQNSLEVLRVPKFNHLHPKTEFITNEFSTIRDLLLSFNTPERQFVHDVDKGPGWSTSIIYNIDADDHMDTFLQELVPLLKQHLSADSFSQVFQYDQPILDLLTTSRRVSSFEKKHVDKLFAQIINWWPQILVVKPMHGSPNLNRHS